MFRGVFAAVILLSGVAVDDGAKAVLERTRSSTTTYASYEWMTVRDEEGANLDGWAAEFHRGDWHRIETQWRHALTNCRTGDAYIYEVSSGTLRQFDDKQNATCGVTSAGGIESVERLPSVSIKPYGRLDFIRVTDARRIRNYQVDSRGLLVRADWFQRDGSRFPCLIQEPVAILRVLPAQDIFSVKSIAKAVTPERYRQNPMPATAKGPSGKSCS